MANPSRISTSKSVPDNDIQGYAVQEKPLGYPRPLRVIAVGAGASGLNFARQVELHMSNIDLTIYEKNPEVGGTWWENRYPGCACDIPSHNYQFTWEPNPNWSTLYVVINIHSFISSLLICLSYSRAREILEYFRNVAGKYDLYRYIKLNHRVVGAEWDDSGGIWKIQVENLNSGAIFDDWCHFMISASGILKLVPGISNHLIFQFTDACHKQLEMAKYPRFALFQRATASQRGMG